MCWPRHTLLQQVCSEACLLPQRTCSPQVCQLAYMLTAMSVVYYAIVWQETHDLATPATAALCSVLLELWLCQHEAAQSRQRRSQGSRRT